MTNELAIKNTISDYISEYEYKMENIENELRLFEEQGEKLKSASCVKGVFGNTHIDTGRPYIENLKHSIKVSAWTGLYNTLHLNRIMSAKDKQNFERALSDCPEFTIETIRATFGNYIKDPRSSILKGLAEVFSTLDPYYKSHDKVKIGVKGLPKRVIISGFKDFSSHGKDRLKDILNALAAYQGLPLVEYVELNAILDDGYALYEENEFKLYDKKTYKSPARGVWLKRYSNGNAHLYFDKKALRDINMALAEYYGDVLPDGYESKPEKKAESTEVSKDLQFYYTPKSVCYRLLDDVYFREGDKILEPSCGEGHIIDAIHVKLEKEVEDSYSKTEKTNVIIQGIEYDSKRAETCREKGYKVYTANFLEVNPSEAYNKVIMNPPFYGKHYIKHIEHALKFLKDDGELISILPITARYDHKLLDKYNPRWYDLPVGSFSETGTNINTTIIRIWKKNATT